MRWTRPSEWPWGRWRQAVSPPPEEREEDTTAEAEPEAPEDDLLTRAGNAAWRLLALGAIGVIAVWALAQISTVVIPAVLAVFLTALLQPMAAWLRRNGLGRGLSTLITFLGSLIVFSLVIYFIVDRAIAGVPDLVERVSQFIAGFQEWLVDLGMDAELIYAFLDEAQREVQSWLQDNLQDNVQDIISGAWTGALAIGQVLFGLVLLLVLTIYFLHSGDKLMTWIGSLMPGQTRRVVLSSSQVTWDVMGRYVRGVALVGLFDAVGIGIMLIALSTLDLLPLNLALPLIVLTFIGAFLPVVGAFVTGALAAIVALVTGGWVVGLIVLLWVIFIQQLESNVFAPRIYGRSLDLPSPVVLLGISIGAILAGIVGMFLATPVVAVLAALLRNRPVSEAASAGTSAGAEQSSPSEAQEGGAMATGEGAPASESSTEEGPRSGNR